MVFLPAIFLAIMSIYKEYKQLNLPNITSEILDYWKRDNTFQKSIDHRNGAKPFVFYEGPPSANGLPGIHHVMARTIKDIFCRYKTLQGFQVQRKAGWDTHGLPVELSVEKALNITKEDIGKKISVEDYNKACRDDVMKYTHIWNDLTDKMGYWVNMDNPYVTYDNNYIESVWWLLQQLHTKNLLYKGYTIQPYSPAAGTGLSSHELNQPGCYRNVKDTSAVVMFKLLPNDIIKTSDPVYCLAWTTTPWTLPSNTALALGENIEYVLVETLNTYSKQKINIVLAKELLGKYFTIDMENVDLSTYQTGDKKTPFRIVNSFTGKQLNGIRYEQLLPYAQPDDGDAFKIILGDFVTTSDGTGIVHIAPSFGADDFRVAKQNGIGSLTLVDKTGKFTKEVNDAIYPLQHQYVKEAYLNDAEKTNALAIQQKQLSHIIKELKNYLSVDEIICLKLQQENKLFKKEKYEHNYPHCWRTDKPILYYPLDSWFIKTTAAKDRLIELNKTINWKPEHTGTGRFGNWLENLNDWNLSRSRFWGIPLPIWQTADTSEKLVIGSIAQLKTEITKSIQAGIMKDAPAHFHAGEDFDLHKPYIDQIVLVSSTGKAMHREPDLIDVWFDSGAMPYAQLHYPFENKALIDEKKYFPADFIAEGVDQTRGWFFTLHTIGVLIFDSIAYKNVVSNGLVLDKNGNKMSKRLGNAVDPFETLAKYGADATRWYMIANAAPWDNLKFDAEGIVEVQRKLFGTLYNTYNFFAIYANIDKFHFDANTESKVTSRLELDQWVISKLNSLIAEVIQYYENYEPHRAARAIEDFVDEHLSNWYVRLSRRRFWKGTMDNDKIAAYETLYQCLHSLSQLMSPIAPFFSDWLFQNLTQAKQSVHLTNLVVSNSNYINVGLEQKMDYAQRITSMILSIRKKENIKVRQPLQKIQIPILDASIKNNVEAVQDLILSEVNVKQLEFVDEQAVQIIKQLKLNFKLIGQKYGKHMKAIQTYAQEHANQLIADIEQTASHQFNIADESIKLTEQDVEIIPVDIPGWKVANSRNLTVALDIKISEDLKNEGLAREFINRVQNIRKSSDLAVTDKINVLLLSHNLLNNAIQSNYNYICGEILADTITIINEEKPNSIEVEIEENLKTKLIIQKI